MRLIHVGTIPEWNSAEATTFDPKAARSLKMIWIDPVYRKADEWPDGRHRQNFPSGPALIQALKRGEDAYVKRLANGLNLADGIALINEAGGRRFTFRQSCVSSTSLRTSREGKRGLTCYIQRLSRIGGCWLQRMLANSYAFLFRNRRSEICGPTGASSQGITENTEQRPLASMLLGTNFPLFRQIHILRSRKSHRWLDIDVQQREQTHCADCEACVKGSFASQDDVAPLGVDVSFQCAIAD